VCIKLGWPVSAVIKSPSSHPASVTIPCPERRSLGLATGTRHGGADLAMRPGMDYLAVNVAVTREMKVGEGLS
jgi:hypothetical protein